MLNTNNTLRSSLIVALLFWVVPLQAQTPIYLDSNAAVQDRVEDLLARMTLEEKIGQMMQVDLSTATSRPADITNYFVGSMLSGGDSDPTGGNTAATWANMYNSFQTRALATRLKVPMIYGVDAVHGHNNVFGATVFPHNIGLGCTRNPELIEDAGRVTAVEMAATGVDWNFGPCITVPRDERWGRTYEGFGETPELAEMGALQVRGLQGDSLTDPTSILACPKHYLADGGTLGGDDQGNAVVDEATLRSIHLPGYIAALQHGAGSVMASFSSVNGVKMHGNKYWLTDVLKTELGFTGIVVSDWGGVDQLSGDYKQAVETSINAGIDMVMLPARYADFRTAMLNLVSEGKISEDRIDDAVRRILTIKFRMGLFEQPYADTTLLAQVGSTAHRAVARQCVRESLVLLKRKDGVLPLPREGARILVAGSHADNLGYQCGGWTINWQGRGGEVTEGTTVLEALAKAVSTSEIVFSETGDFDESRADYSIVVIGEQPYAEGNGDRSDLSVSKAHVDLVRKMKSYGNPVVVILISGRPLLIESILHFSDAIIAAWLPGTEGDGIADVLFGDHQPKGLLSHSWPRTMDQIPINAGDWPYWPRYPYAYGITTLENPPAGSEPIWLSAIVGPGPHVAELTFSKSIDSLTLPGSMFQINRNGTALPPAAVVLLKEGDPTTIVLQLDSAIAPRDSVTIEYVSGSIASVDGGLFWKGSGMDAYNLVTASAVTVPGKLEADTFSDMFGVEVGATTDTDGGMDLHAIDNGDWMEYFIHVPRAAYYFLTLRTASESTQGRVSVSSSGRLLGSRTVPVTGSWQTWTTQRQVIGLVAGEQTLRLDVQTGGFRLHWLAIENTSGVEEDAGVPLITRLEQNYPNPFNPTTVVSSRLSTASDVKLTVYDLLGREVVVLANERRAAGRYQDTFDGSGLASGVYICRMKAGGYAESRPMTLLR